MGSVHIEEHVSDSGKTVFQKVYTKTHEKIYINGQYQFSEPLIDECKRALANSFEAF